MLKISNLKIDNSCLGKQMMLVDINAYYDFNSDTREVLGFKYKVVLPQLKMEALEVKIEGQKRLELKDGSYPLVSFDGLEIKPYVIRGDVVITATAKGVAIVKDGAM